MKKIATLILFLGCIQLNAQENKGRFMINGNVNYWQNNDSYDGISAKPPYPSQPPYTINSKNSSIGVNLGYFITNNFALGLSNRYSFDARTAKYGGYPIQNSHQENFTYTTGIFARYNQPINHSKFGVFLQLNGVYGWKKGSDERFDGTGSKMMNNSSSGIAISITPGIIYFINQKFSVEASFGYLGFSSFKGQDYNSTSFTANQFNFDLALASANFGFSYYFGGKKAEEKKSNE